jgi:hypothetical protein
VVPFFLLIQVLIVIDFLDAVKGLLRFQVGPRLIQSNLRNSSRITLQICRKSESTKAVALQVSYEYIYTAY